MGPKPTFFVTFFNSFWSKFTNFPWFMVGSIFLKMEHELWREKHDNAIFDMGFI